MKTAVLLLFLIIQLSHCVFLQNPESKPGFKFSKGPTLKNPYFVEDNSGNLVKQVNSFCEKILAYCEVNDHENIVKCYRK